MTIMSCRDIIAQCEEDNHIKEFEVTTSTTYLFRFRAVATNNAKWSGILSLGDHVRGRVVIARHNIIVCLGVMEAVVGKFATTVV